jgi:hypothetical protein
MVVPKGNIPNSTTYTTLTLWFQYARIRQASCCPSFLIGLTGHQLAVWGAVFADRFYFERLACLFIGPQPQSGGSMGTRRSDFATGIRQVAKLLKCLRNGLDSLEAYYKNLSIPLVPSAPPESSRGGSRRSSKAKRTSGSSTGHLSTLYTTPSAVQFPYWPSYTDAAGITHRVIYEKRLAEDYFSKTIFLIRSQTESQYEPSPLQVLKFSFSYSERAHSLLAKLNLAPQLHYCKYEESLGMWAVVMDFIDCRLGKTRRLSTVHKEKLHTAVTSLHKAGYVFGDLRWPNVLLPDDLNLHLVDFEWAGEEGAVRYPTDILLGKNMGWHPDVGKETLVKKEHDVYRLQRMIDDV